MDAHELDPPGRLSFLSRDKPNDRCGPRMFRAKLPCGGPALLGKQLPPSSIAMLNGCRYVPVQARSPIARCIRTDLATARANRPKPPPDPGTTTKCLLRGQWRAPRAYPERRAGHDRRRTRRPNDHWAKRNRASRPWRLARADRFRTGGARSFFCCRVPEFRYPGRHPRSAQKTSLA